MMKLAAIVLSTSMLIAFGTAEPHIRISQAASADRQVMGAAISIRGGGNTVLVRTSSHSVVAFNLAGRPHLTTADGHALASANIRLGDRLTRFSGGKIVDASQRLRTLKGVVSLGPLGENDPLVAQINPTWSVMADSSSRTQYADASHETSGVREIQDGDLVRLQGVYDTTLGEMTRTDKITRLGPFHRKHASGGAGS